MKLKNLLFAAVATISVACAADKSENDNTTAQPPVVDVSPEEIAARNALVKQTPQMALVKVPLDANGEPVFEAAEVRTSMQTLDISSEEKMLAAFEGAPAAESVTVNINDSLDSDSSSNSWALLPWRNRIENGLPVRDGPYLLPWRRAMAYQHNSMIYGNCGNACPPPPCGNVCAPPPPPPRCVKTCNPCVKRCDPCAPRPTCQTTTVVTTTTTCSTCGGGMNTSFAPQAVPYYNYGGYQWDYQAQQGYVSGNNYYYGATNAYGQYAASLNWL